MYYAIKMFDLPFEINMVIADRDCGAIEFAKKSNLNFNIIDYSKSHDIELINVLKTLDTDIIVTTINKILTPDVLKSTKADFINLHYLLLPAFAGLTGMKTVDETRKQNCQFIGATCHEVTEVLDGGKICHKGFLQQNGAETRSGRGAICDIAF